MKSASINVGILCIALGTALAWAEVTQYPEAAPESASAAVILEQPGPVEAPAPVARILEPPLDVAALKTRLRETRSAHLPSSH